MAADSEALEGDSESGLEGPAEGLLPFWVGKIVSLLGLHPAVALRFDTTGHPATGKAL